jgi:hypothetical protein
MGYPFLRTLIGLAIISSPFRDAPAHDIYTGIHDKTGQLCCGGDDCAATSYRENGGRFEFYTRERRWVQIPQDRITFLPIPGDSPGVSDNPDAHRAHLCYRAATETDRLNNGSNVFGDILLYCAFIPPGSI